jgi:hypothetical protein
MQNLRAAAVAYRDIRQQNSFILSGMTASHALFHGFRQSLLVLSPHVRDTMGISVARRAAGILAC